MSSTHTPHKEGTQVSEKFALQPNNNPHQHPHPPQKEGETRPRKPSFRCSQPLSTNQTPHPTTKAGQQPEPPKKTPRAGTPPHSGRDPRACCLRTQQCVWQSHRRPDFPSDRTCLLCTRTPPTTGESPSHESLRTPNPHTMWAGRSLVVLLRKEVIQPHLPVRLPCYDFVPIADPTFDGSLPQGVRPPASGVTDFHDVTGGVYKARERIHRSVADLRLLATPTSRGRVADPDPN